MYKGGFLDVYKDKGRIPFIKDRAATFPDISKEEALVFYEARQISTVVEHLVELVCSKIADSGFQLSSNVEIFSSRSIVGRFASDKSLNAHLPFVS